MTPADKALRKKLALLIERYGSALVADSWKGGGDPDDIPDIEYELEKARAKLELILNTEVFTKQKEQKEQQA